MRSSGSAPTLAPPGVPTLASSSGTRTQVSSSGRASAGEPGASSLTLTSWMRLSAVTRVAPSTVECSTCMAWKFCTVLIT